MNRTRSLGPLQQEVKVEVWATPVSANHKPSPKGLTQLVEPGRAAVPSLRWPVTPFKGRDHWPQCQSAHTKFPKAAPRLPLPRVMPVAPSAATSISENTEAGCECEHSPTLRGPPGVTLMLKEPQEKLGGSCWGGAGKGTQRGHTALAFCS